MSTQSDLVFYIADVSEMARDGYEKARSAIPYYKRDARYLAYASAHQQEAAKYAALARSSLFFLLKDANE